jgi:16S rRNA (cytosine967-C5)-methyltransferase
MTPPPATARKSRPRAPTARRVALDTLVSIGEGARANVALPAALAATRLEQRDRNLVTELVYGACRMQRACDWLTDRYTRGSVDKEVRAALRVGAYQIAWTRIPAHAAVSATVEEVRGPGRSVVNAVLRRVAEEVGRGLVAWPDAATQLSYPDWIVGQLDGDLGTEAARLALATMNDPASVSTRPDGYIQDLASQMVVAHLARYTGPRALDLCAAPGGKATGLAGSAASPVHVTASDLSEPRSRVIAENARRLALTNLSTVVADAAAPPYRERVFDLVLLDAPCSGLGVLRRRPDARWRIRQTDVKRLAALQRGLLGSARRLVAPGGVLAYCVCTMTADETAGIDNWLSQEHPDLKPIPPPQAPWTHAGRGARLLPQDAGTDGMFLLALRVP